MAPHTSVENWGMIKNIIFLRYGSQDIQFLVKDSLGRRLEHKELGIEHDGVVEMKSRKNVDVTFKIRPLPSSRTAHKSQGSQGAMTNEMSPEAVRSLSIAMGISSGVSLVCCLAVTLLIYTNEKLYERNLCKFIIILMINEMGNALGMSLGNSTNGSFDCWLQSFLTVYFPYCQSFWLTLTAWMLHRIIMFSQPTNLLSLRSFFLCSGVPLLLTLLPLTTNDYGNEGDSSGWCFLKNRSTSPAAAMLVWSCLYYFIVFTNILAYMAVLLLSRNRLRRSRNSLRGQPAGNALSGILVMMHQLVWYPRVIFLTVLPEAMYDIVVASSGDGSGFGNNLAFIFVSHVTPTVRGVGMSMAFVLCNAEANEEVRRLLGLSPALSDTVPLSSARDLSVGNVGDVSINVKSNESSC